MHFHRDVGQVVEAVEQPFVVVRLLWFVRHHRDDGSEVSGTHTPEVEVTHTSVGVRFKSVDDLPLSLSRDLSIEQHCSSVSDEPDGPTGDDDRGQHPRDTIQPGPPKVLASEQRGDRKQ